MLEEVENHIGRYVGLLSAIGIGFLASVCLWLWTENSEMVVVSSLINGFLSCF